MRTNPASRSGVFNPLLCPALLLCLIAVLLGAASFAVPTPPSGALSIKDASLAEATPGAVTITEFSDFQCPYCKQAASVVGQLRQAYGDRVKVNFKQLPLPM